MKVTVSFLHLEHTDSLDQKIHEKSQKLKKYFGSYAGESKCLVKWNCFVKNGDHIAEVSFFAQGFKFFASANSDSMYKTLDLVIDKLEKQITKQKDKYNKIHKDHKEAIILDPEMAWTDRDDVA